MMKIDTLQRHGQAFRVITTEAGGVKTSNYNQQVMLITLPVVGVRQPPNTGPWGRDRRIVVTSVERSCVGHYDERTTGAPHHTVPV